MQAAICLEYCTKRAGALRFRALTNSPARLSMVLAMTEAFYVKARLRRGGVSALPDPIRRGRVCRSARSLGNFGRRLVDHHGIHHLFLRCRRHIGL